MSREEAAYYLLQELLGSRLEVVAVGGCRKVISENAPWYREFCAAYAFPRKRYPRPRTLIKRSNTIRTLDRIAKGLPAGPVYTERLERFLDGYNPY